MRLRAADIPELGFQAGDHVCAFYSEGGYSHDDIVVNYVSKGLQAGKKCGFMIETASSVRARIPGELVSRDGMLQFLTEEQGHPPVGEFSKDTFIRNMEAVTKD